MRVFLLHVSTREAGRAAEILLTGRFVDADEAASIGLVSRVVAADSLLNEAFALADSIVANSSFGVRLTKADLTVNVDAPSLESAIDLENRNQVLATRTSDMAEALTAFREKRAPVLSGDYGAGPSVLDGVDDGLVADLVSI